MGPEEILPTTAGDPIPVLIFLGAMVFMGVVVVLVALIKD